MTSKVQFLFDMSNLLHRPTPEQKEFEEVNYAFLQSVPELVLNAFETTRNEMKGKVPLSMNFLWFANTMNGNMIAEIAREYPEYIKPTGRKNYTLMLPPNYECPVKKLNKGSLRPAYNHTITTAAMIQQLAKKNQEPLPLIFIGYVLSKANDKVMGTYAVCFKGKERMWVSDLSSLQPPASGNQFITPVTPDAPAPQVGVRVIPKKKAQ